MKYTKELGVDERIVKEIGELSDKIEAKLYILNGAPIYDCRLKSDYVLPALVDQSIDHFENTIEKVGIVEMIDLPYWRLRDRTDGATIYSATVRLDTGTFFEIKIGIGNNSKNEPTVTVASTPISLDDPYPHLDTIRNNYVLFNQININPNFDYEGYSTSQDYFGKCVAFRLTKLADKFNFIHLPPLD